MGNTQIIAALQMELGHAPSGMNTDSFNEKRGYAQKLLMNQEAHQSVKNGINANLSMSQQGQMAALKKPGNETTAPALKWMKNVIKEMQDKDQGYRQQFYAVTSGIENAVERLLWFTYLWDRLDPLDQSARVTQFLQASERDDLKVLAAMLENPFGPMVNEEVKTRALTERAQRLFPRDYEIFEQNALLLEFLTMARDWIARWLREEVGVDIAVVRANLGDEIPAGV